MEQKQTPLYMGDRAWGPWFVLASAVLWGTAGTAQALAPAGVTPSTVGALRLVLGGLILLLVAALRGDLRRGGPWPPVITAVTTLSMAAYQLFFFVGVARTGVAIGTIVTIGSSPVLAGLLGWLFRRERPGRRWAQATALAVAGCALLIGGGSAVRLDPAGILFALGAGLAYAGYATFGKALLDRHPPGAVVAVVFSLGALLVLPLLLRQDLTWLTTPRGIGVALHLGLLATALAHGLFAAGLARITVATAVTLTLAEPLTAALLGALLLREELTVLAWVGCGLLLAGFLLLTRGEASGSRERPVGQSTP